jgi:hypothetical protein
MHSGMYTGGQGVKMEAGGSFEMLVTTGQTASRHVPEDSSLQG